MLDSTIVKKLRFTERIGGELRVDVFNILNHPNFSNPNTSVTNPNFGVINGTTPFNNYANPRAMRLGARVTF